MQRNPPCGVGHNSQLERVVLAITANERACGVGHNSQLERVVLVLTANDWPAVLDIERDNPCGVGHNQGKN